MSGCMKPTRQLELELRIASLQIVKLAAVVTQEMMMVFLSGEFVPGGRTGHLDGNQPFLLNQRFYVAINGRNVQMLHFPLRKLFDLFR